MDRHTAQDQGTPDREFPVLIRARQFANAEAPLAKQKSAVAKHADDLRKEYDLAQLKHGIREKYYRQATAGTNLALIDPALMDVFPNGEAVDRALRILAEAARSATSPKRRRAR